LGLKCLGKNRNDMVFYLTKQVFAQKVMSWPHLG
jgi:hypothetical protein